MKNLFSKYLNSVLTPDEFSEFTEYVCDERNDLIVTAWMKSTWDKHLHETFDKPATNPVLFDNISKAISIEKKREDRRKIKLYSWSLRIAAVLTLGLILSNIFFVFKTGLNKETATGQTIFAPHGAKSNITLPDGSNVWLNSGSQLSFNTKFSKKRNVTLSGEAYFEVVKSEKPFVVNTKNGNVEVKGTSFNVKSYPDDDDFETTLEKGIVVFRAKDSEKRFILKPGEQVTKTFEGFTKKKVETKYFTSWKDGKLLFYREPFPDFVKRLQRWYNVKIEYTDPALEELWYTGTIEMESINEVMEMISKTAPVTYSFNNKSRVFTIRAK